ncbi:MAG: PD-(D/E)XK nuclease family protein [Candidatus Omnitrophota bacterium]
MSNIITYNFNEDFIEKLSEYIFANFYISNKDLSRLAIVFGGKRPALFLKQALAQKIKTDFISPYFFSIDEFMYYINNKNGDLMVMQDLEAAYIVYKIAKTKVPPITQSREKFSQFLPWSREIISFIDQLDLENISKDRLTNIEKNAQIGYEVPDNLNKLLENIVTLRELYHQKMQKDKKYSRGLRYLTAANQMQNTPLNEFDKILFCNFFDLHATEKIVIKHYYDQGKAVLFFQKDEHNWSVFNELSEFFNTDIKPQNEYKRKLAINFYAGFDTHSQVGIVRELLAKITDEQRNKTVIVLPNSDNIIPLLSEISSITADYNVSMGYPLLRSTLYGLFEAIHRVQKTRKKNQYYTRDYLALMRHPLIKNLLLIKDPAITRVLVHKIEELLSGMQDSEVSGSLFIELEQIENLTNLYLIANEQLELIDISITIEDLQEVLVLLHNLAFRLWEQITTLERFSASLEKFLDVLVEKSLLSTYPLNNKIIQKIYGLCRDFSNKNLSQEKFQTQEIFKIFDDFLRSEKIAFKGMPLKGLQILGLFETRAISFENVIIMDVNESVLPRLSANEPLIPRAVMVSLGLDRLEREENIQRYQFMRLIKSAKNVHLIYNDHPDMQKSRFIEEILWEEEKQNKTLNSSIAPRAVFKCEVMQKRGVIAKDESIKKFLENFVFSASSINTYLQCPMQFYFKYVLGLSEKEDLLDEVESKEVGIFIHELLEYSFKPFLKKTPRINDLFKNKFFKEFNDRFEKTFMRRMKSDAFMIKQILHFRLEKFLDQEAERKIIRIEGLEQEIVKEIRLGVRSINFKCRIDRIDRIDAETVQVLDYKTGSSDTLPGGVKILAKAMDNPARVNIKKAIGSFQLPLYIYCVEEEYKDAKIKAALYNLRTLRLDKFPKDKEYDDKDKIMEYCGELLRVIIDEIYDLKAGFRADESKDTCPYCPFVNMCK